MVLTASDLGGGWVISIQELLDYLVNVQDPSHQAVHLLVQRLKPTRSSIEKLSQVYIWTYIKLFKTFLQVLHILTVGVSQDVKNL